MLKKYPATEISLSRNTFIEKEKRPFWRFWRIENATLHIEPRRFWRIENATLHIEPLPIEEEG